MLRGMLRGLVLGGRSVRADPEGDSALAGFVNRGVERKRETDVVSAVGVVVREIGVVVIVDVEGVQSRLGRVGGHEGELVLVGVGGVGLINGVGIVVLDLDRELCVAWPVGDGALADDAGGEGGVELEAAALAIL